ncbi:MAG: putative Peptidase signal peptidase [Candidatus Saccharibacteria bacterium]|nr:putative Peptidase signal peptidase [Candidatus Saccharibacteria bacterium]
MSQPLTTRRVFALGARSAAYMLSSLLLAAAVGLVSLHLRGQHLMSVQSASMAPIFGPGDALVVEPISAAQLHVGDIVSYQSPRDPAVIISHRLIAISKQTGFLTTAGDRLHAPDRPFPPGRVIGRAVAVAPALGSVMNFARSPLGLAVLVYVPALSVLISEARHLIRISQRPTYRLTMYRQ